MSPRDDDGQGSLVNMFGPTITNGASLTRVGVPEIELYYVAQNSCPAFIRQQQSQFLVKYAFSRQWMAMVGSNGFVRQTADPLTTTDFADPQITLKYLYQPPRGNGDLASVQLTYKVPAGDPAKAINTGSPDYHLFWMYTRPMGECSLDVNVWLSNVGADDGTRRLLLNESAALTVPLNDRMSYQGEVYHFGSNGPVEGITSTLHALTYSLSPTVSLAVNVDFGLSTAAPRVNYGIGCAFSLGGPSTSSTSPRAWTPVFSAPLGAMPPRR